MSRVAVVVLVACAHPVVFHAGAVEHSLPRDEAGLDKAAIDRVLETAADQQSSAVVIARDGKIVVERYRAGYDGAPLVAMSASKSIVAMAVGVLIADGKLTLDTTLATLFPDWHDPAKAVITVRALLSQTSGLEPSRAAFKTGETIVDHAARAHVVFAPNTHFQYNNGGVDLLAAIVERAAGESLHDYLERKIFRELDIVGAKWMTDAAGTARGAGELIIRPVDLVKLGQLVLDGGRWNGKQVLAADWVAAMTAPSQPFHADYGLLWWRDGPFANVLDASVIEGWRAAGVDAELIERARPLLGRAFVDLVTYRRALAKLIGRDGFTRLLTTIGRGDHVELADRVAAGPSVGFSARGWLGQYLVIVPRTRTVAVRMRASTRDDYEQHHNEDSDFEFIAQIDAL